jgi:LptD protein
MVRSFPLFSQDEKSVADTIIVRQDTLGIDSLSFIGKQISPNAIDKQVKYTAKGLKRNDLVNRRAVLTEEAQVDYGDMEIRADSIVFDMAKNTVYAAGRKDTAGKVIGKPVFKQGSQEIESDSLLYDFVTRKAVAYRIVTKQEEGLLHSEVTKLLEDGTSNVARSTYSTCDAYPPHFYIALPKAKIYPGKKIISGPGYLVLEGIPLPIALPFGFFPIQTKKAASGILIPRVGQEALRGYNLTEGGYYFAISQFFDLALKGNIYTNGTWMLTAESKYSKRYKFDGAFSFSYANNISGHKGLKDYSKTTNYKLGWTYNQNAKAHPGSRFSANVNMSSSGFDRTNSYVVSEHVTTQRQSSVSYSKTWEGTPFNMSMSMNHSQNVRNKTVALDLPKFNFNVGRIYPFKGKNSVGRKWYQELQFQYSASLDNQINTYDSLLFTRNVWKNMRNGFKHEAPLSIQFRPFRNFSISPQVTYTGVIYTQKFLKRWDPQYFDPQKNEIMPKVVTDTLRGTFYGQSFSPSISAGYNPQIFGYFTFGPKSRLQQIRHVMKPSVSFSYVPMLNRLNSKLYRQVQSDTIGHTNEYSIFEGNIYGTPSLARRSGNISFNLTNILEAKVFERNDTTGKPKKVKIIDNFGISTSYNIFADSLRWSPIAMGLRTTLFNNVGISANSSFSLYGLNSSGNPIGIFEWTQNRKLMRLTNFNVSVDFDLKQLIAGDKGKKGTGTAQQGQPSPVQAGTREGPGTENTALGGLSMDEYGYAIFDVPWSMRVSYNLNYSKPGLKKYAQLAQTLAINGNVTLTKKTAITYTSGYDFRANEITMTQIGITRDLHCWTMSFNWIPNGTMKMWNFTIRVKAAVLADLKYERRKDYHDLYY